MRLLDPEVTVLSTALASILLDSAVLMTLFWTGLVEVDERAESTVI